jgi:hypothetical protein
MRNTVQASKLFAIGRHNIPGYKLRIGGRERRWAFKPRQNDLMHVLRRPVEIAGHLRPLQ